MGAKEEALISAANRHMLRGEARTAIIQTSVNLMDEIGHQFQTSSPFMLDEISWTLPSSVAVVVTAPPSHDSMELYALSTGARLASTTHLGAAEFPYVAFTPKKWEHGTINTHIEEAPNHDEIKEYRAQADQLDLRIGLVRRTQCSICAPVDSYVMFNHAVSLPANRYAGVDQRHHHRAPDVDTIWQTMVAQKIYCDVCVPGELLTGDMDADTHMLNNLDHTGEKEQEAVGGMMMASLLLQLKPLLVGHHPYTTGGTGDLGMLSGMLLEHADSLGNDTTGPAKELVMNQANSLELVLASPEQREQMAEDYMWRLFGVLDNHGACTSDIALLRNAFYDGDARGILG